MAERRPTLTASARVGVRNLRSGQKKACGAVEQKKGPRRESKSARKKALAFVAAIRERRNASRGRTKEWHLKRRYDRRAFGRVMTPPLPKRGPDAGRRIGSGRHPGSGLKPRPP